MRSIISILILSFIAFSCKQEKAKPESPFSIDSIAKENKKITLINDPEQLHRIQQDFKSFWIPTTCQLMEIDSILLMAIKENAKVFPRQLTNYSNNNFYRQFSCYILANGDSIAFINALCRISNDPVFDKNNNVNWKRRDWQHYFIIVCDGGECYWQIQINFSKKSYKDFIINGEA